jgi:ferric-dicitrate binding protein FerR (iron transport regulator)
MRRSSAFNFFLVSFAGLLLIGVPRLLQASDLSYARIVRVSLVSGDVQISRPGHESWEAASQNMPVTQGVTIGTNNGYAEVQFEDGSTAWISENTLVQFTELALADGGRITKLTLAQGTMSILAAMHRGDTFTLSTREETIAVPKNAFFRVDSFHDGGSISVLGGAVDVTSAAGTKSVPKGKTLAYRAKLSDVSLSSNPKADDWDRWTIQRAQTSQTEAAQSSSYVDAPFSYGLADMTDYGSWNYFAGYGYGWQPYGAAGCWMPFANGDWDFYPGFGWTWVSGEPWGWIPYHFGSWNFLPSYGWTWFPSQFGFWDPAPVDWYSAGNQVGWEPMGFGDPSELAFGQMTYGCPGFGGAPYGGAGASRLGRAVFPVRRIPARPGAAGPHLLLTTNRLGTGDRIGLLSYYGGDSQTSAIRSTEPLENGKPSGVALSAFAANQRSFSTLVPTVPDIAHLQRSLILNGANNSAPRLMPSASTQGTLRAVNAMPLPRMPSHRPSPIVSQAGYHASTGGYFGSGDSGNNSSVSATSVRAFAASSSGAAHSGGGGKPH